MVIDSGWSRLPRYDARAGLTRLDTIRVSRASADQRRGRAGRVAPGVCYRLWDAAEDHVLVPRTRPEILDADLSALALELAQAGVQDPATVRWSDQPPTGAFAQARDLLRQLGTEMVALLEERDVLRGDGGPPPADLRLRLDALRRATDLGDTASLHSASIDHDAMRRVRELVRQLQRHDDTERHAQDANDDLEHVGLLLALEFPDRLAQRRHGNDPRFVMRAGTGGAANARGGPGRVRRRGDDHRRGRVA